MSKYIKDNSIFSIADKKALKLIHDYDFGIEQEMFFNRFFLNIV
jgi:hypothetical protein